jgi:hypothetical protein
MTQEINKWSKATVFAIALAGAFVSDLKGHTGGVQTIHEHAFPRCMQPKFMHAALVTDLPNYASAIVTTNEIVEALSFKLRPTQS